MKPKPKFTKHQRKSPVVTVIVERTAPPEPEPVTVPSDTPTSPPAEIPEPEEPKEVRKQTVKTIASRLGEPKEKIGQIAVIVKHLGTHVALGLMEEALSIEANGGMLTNNGERRRTPGGIFFTLVRTRHEQIHFRPKRKRRRKPEAFSPPPIRT